MTKLYKLHLPAYYALESSLLCTDHDHPIGDQWKQFAWRSLFFDFEDVVESEETFDVNSLFTVVGILLKHSTPTNTDEVAQEKIDDTTLEVDFNIPLGTLKEIGCELLCKNPDPNICDQKTRSILKKLSNYSWKAKVVLTVAAFVTKFGDAWLKLDNKLSESSDQLEKSRQEVTKLKNLMNTTLQLIEIILDLEMPTFSSKTPFQALKFWIMEMPTFSSKTPFQALTFWIIMTIIACASQVTIITSDNQDGPYDLYPYSQIIQFILSTLTEHLKDFGVLEKEEADQYLSLQEFLKHPNDAVEVFKALFSAGDYMPPLIYCPTKEQVAIDVLRGKKIWIVISGLDISDEEITNISKADENMTTINYNQGKIVWVPIVEQWTDELDKEFSTVQSKMPCYCLKSSLTTLGMTFVKHECYYTARPVLVQISPKGILLCHDNLKEINYYAPGWAVERAQSSIGLMRNQMHAFRLEEKYTFFYGGKDREWIKQFEKKARKMVDDPIIKSAKITIVLQYVQKSSSGGQSSNIMGSLMNAIQSLSSPKNSVPPEIMQQLLPHQNENGWAVLCKESSIVGVGHGDAIIRVLGEFDQWKQHVPEKGFRDTFNEYHATIINQRP